jgi:hypothetical protein
VERATSVSERGYAPYGTMGTGERSDSSDQTTGSDSSGHLLRTGRESSDGSSSIAGFDRYLTLSLQQSKSCEAITSQFHDDYSDAQIDNDYNAGNNDNADHSANFINPSRRGVSERPDSGSTAQLWSRSGQCGRDHRVRQRQRPILQIERLPRGSGPRRPREPGGSGHSGDPGHAGRTPKRLDNVARCLAGTRPDSIGRC